MAGERRTSGAPGRVKEGALVGTVAWAVSQPYLTDPCAVPGPRLDLREAHERVGTTLPCPLQRWGTGPEGRVTLQQASKEAYFSS